MRFTLPLLALAALISCGKLLVKAPEEDNLILADIEFVLEKIDAVYPLLEYKGIDFDSLYTVYMNRAAEAEGDEAYQLLFDLLRELKDPHVYYLTEGAGIVMPYPGIRLLRDREAYSPFVVRTYFDSKLQSTHKGKVNYGILPGNIGYIYIATFTGVGIMNDFYVVMDYVKDTDGLIIDVRGGSGGYHGNVVPVVSRFLESTLEYPPLFTKGEVPYYDDDWALIEPDSLHYRYSNDVVVLINGASLSTGELFPELMKQLPQVTAVGDTTNGAGCNDIADHIEGDYFLPSGKYIHIGTTSGYRYDGVILELNGVPPDIRIPQTAEDIRKGVDRQLEYAMEFLNHD